MKRSLLSTIYIGIEKTASAIRIAKVRGNACLDVCEIPFSNGHLYLNSVAKDLIAATHLPSSASLVRGLSIPIKKKKDALSAARFQLEPLLPYPLEEAVIDSQLTSLTAAGSLVTLFSVKKEVIKSCLEQWNAIDIDPQVVLSKCAALNAFAAKFVPDQLALWTLHCESEETTLLYSENSKVLASKTCGNDLNEVYKTFLSISSAFKNRGKEKLLLLGSPSFSLSSIKEKIPLEMITSDLLPQDLKADHFCISIGSALAAQSAFNFRETSFPYKFPLKKLFPSLAFFLATFAVAFASLFFAGTALIHSKKQSLEKQVDFLLNQKGSLAKKESLESKLYSVEKMLLTTTDPYPLFPQIPRVVDLFAWLSTLASSDFEGVSIENFRYTLEKYPNANQKSEKYLPKVELEIVSPSPQVAQAFHDELKNHNPFIDPKKDLGWTLGKGKYKASFYLKDKTRYQG